MMFITHIVRLWNNKKPGGYILLLSVLVIGAVSAVVVPSLLLLGISAGQVSGTISQAAEALAAAQGCAEYGLLHLRESSSYAGNEVLTLGSEQCSILTVGGMGNEHRLLCVQGQFGDAVRRMEIIVGQVFPQMTIDSWQEVSSFSLCQ